MALDARNIEEGRVYNMMVFPKWAAALGIKAGIKSAKRLEDMQALHRKIDLQIPVAHHLAPAPQDNDKIVGTLTAGSMVVNATGLGKDRPGSPLTESAVFPENGIAWDFNYRGDLVFLDQANDQKAGRNLTIENGWIYFIHGWTRVNAEVFHIDIPTSGPEFDRLKKKGFVKSLSNATKNQLLPNPPVNNADEIGHLDFKKNHIVIGGSNQNPTR